MKAMSTITLIISTVLVVELIHEGSIPVAILSACGCIALILLQIAFDED